MPLTLPLTASDAPLALAGGKGMNLAALVRADFPVPPGFILTTEAYRTFVSANQLQARLLAVVGGIAADDPLALEAAAAEIAALFEAGQMPPALAAAVAEAYAQLPTTAVAVRSSATAEDLPGLSFAGQQDTYLNIVETEAVLDAVRRCWASLWTARAIAYRARNGIAPESVALAVVVQVMIPSEASGVLFTANPLTGRRDETVIDAAFGLGEALVSGQVEPDHYTVDTRTQTITSRTLGAKGLAIIPRAEGGVDHVQRDAAELQALPDAQIVALTRLAVRAADLFGAPQDIEWAWAGGQLYLLQSRPITSLYPLPEVALPPGAVGVFFSLNSVQGVTGPFTPLGRDTLRLLMGGAAQRILGTQLPPQQVMADAGERMFINLTEAARDPRLRPLLLNVLTRIDPAAQQSLARVIESGQIPLRSDAKHGPPGFVLRVLSLGLPRALAAQIAPRWRRERALATADRFLARVREQARSAPPDLAGRLAVMERALAGVGEGVVLPLLPVILPNVILLSVLDRWLVPWAGAAPGAALNLVRGLPNNPTTEMNLKLWSAAQTIRADPESHAAVRDGTIPELAAHYRQGTLPVVAQRALQDFLDEYGMRAVTEIDFGLERWREDPASVLQTLQAFQHLTDPQTAPDAVFRRGAAEAERLAAEHAARARRGPLGFIKAGVLRFIISRIRALAGLREAPKFYLIKLLDIFRTLLLDSARGLVAEGRLAQSEDIFFVPLGTLKRFAGGEPVDLNEVVAVNRAAYEMEAGRQQMPRLLLSTGEVFYEGMRADDGEPDSADALVGQAVSPGVAEGVVRVVIDPRGTRLEPGEILVCPATDPGWTPLFLTAGGLVMEIGGMMTHGSVVAREYGIPAVVGVQAATRRLSNGQRVRVDGNSGRVTVLKQVLPPPPAAP